MANVEGKATAITVVTPVRPWGKLWLPLLFGSGRRFTFALKKLLQLSFIHYARWAIVPDFPDDAKGEKLKHGYLFFESNFNGLWDEYIDAFSQVVPQRMSAIWGSSYGFPGPRPVGPFKAYIRHNEYVANHYWSAYPGAATTEITSAERVDAAVAELRARADGLSPAQFKAAYDELLTKVQADL